MRTPWCARSKQVGVLVRARWCAPPSTLVCSFKASWCARSKQVGVLVRAR
ncbi:hypothetical protein A2U01_0111232, partial [Trifolium medium]|nr:hypothetical protein [Trifolium medium]